MEGVAVERRKIRQKYRLRKHAEAKGYKYVLIDEIASGINEKRNGIHKLIKMCFEGKVERILIEYKDRLARFGYEYLDAIFKNLEITVEVVETKEKKYEEELAEDIMKILTCYSARFMEGVAVERRKIRLRMSLSNLMEFKKELLKTEWQTLTFFAVAILLYLFGAK